MVSVSQELKYKPILDAVILKNNVSASHYPVAIHHTGERFTSSTDSTSRTTSPKRWDMDETARSSLPRPKSRPSLAILFLPTVHHPTQHLPPNKQRHPNRPDRHCPSTQMRERLQACRAGTIHKHSLSALSCFVAWSSGYYM